MTFECSTFSEMWCAEDKSDLFLTPERWDAYCSFAAKLRLYIYIYIRRILTVQLACTIQPSSKLPCLYFYFISNTLFLFLPCKLCFKKNKYLLYFPFKCFCNINLKIVSNMCTLNNYNFKSVTTFFYPKFFRSYSNCI